MLKRILLFAYGLACYAIFFVTFLYALGFVGNFVVPAAMDGVPRLGTGLALAIDVGLLGLFAVQHSLMARPFFKRWLTRLIPESAERSTYVLFSSLALIVMFVFWQPLGGLVWDVRDAPEGLKAYASRINPEKPDHLLPGYEVLDVAPERLARLLAEMGAMTLPTLLPAPSMGLDGATTCVEIQRGFSVVSLTWWEQGPPEWRGLTDVIREAMTAFHAATTRADVSASR